MSMQVIKLGSPCTPRELINWCWQVSTWWDRQFGPDGYVCPPSCMRAQYEPEPEGDET